MTLSVQFLTLSMMFMSGFALGLLFDVYRVLAAQFRISRISLALFDILYGIIATLLVFKVLYETNQGEVRFFVFIGLLLGLSFYFALVSPAAIKFMEWMIKIIKRMFWLCVRVADGVIVKPAIALYRFIIIILGFLMALSIFLSKIVIQLTHPLWILLKFLFRPLFTRLSAPRWLVAAKDKIVQGIKRRF